MFDQSLIGKCASVEGDKKHNMKEEIFMKKQKGVIYIILAVLCWSVVGLFTKHIPWNGFTIGIARGVVAFFVMLLLVRRFPRHMNRVKIITAVCYFAQGLLFVVANKYTSAANATVLQNTSPIYIMIFSAVIAKKLPRRRDVVTCIVMLLGIVLSFMGSMNTSGMLGNISAIVSGMFYAGVYFSSRRPGADATESTVLGNMFYLFLIPLMFLDTSFVGTFQTLGQDQSMESIIYALGLGILLAVAWFFFSKGIKYVDSLHASFLAMLEPVLAPIWTLIFLREKPGVWAIVGDVIVLGALCMYQLREHTREETGKS